MESDIVALITEAKWLIKKCEDVPLLTYSYSLTEFISNEEEILKLCNDYNSWVNEVKMVLGDKVKILPQSLTIPVSKTNSTKRIRKIDAKYFLEKARIECEKTIASLSKLLEKIKIPKEKSEELNKIEEEVTTLIEPKLPSYAYEVKLAINLVRDGYPLPSVLVCGRVVDVLLNKLRKYFKIENGEWVDKTLYMCKRERLLKEGWEDVVKVVKKWRNMYSHQLIRADIEDCFVMITTTSKLLKSIIKSNLYKSLDLD